MCLEILCIRSGKVIDSRENRAVFQYLHCNAYDRGAENDMIKRQNE